jgi:hypothetical protein
LIFHSFCLGLSPQTYIQYPDYLLLGTTLSKFVPAENVSPSNCFNYTHFALNDTNIYILLVQTCQIKIIKIILFDQKASETLKKVAGESNLQSKEHNI